ncbi:MAG: rubredoxin [Gammaproteobacteria bacterium]
MRRRILFVDGVFGMQKWQCVVCGFIYDEKEGLPEEGIAPGTAWADIPEDWECPDCGVSKASFEMVPVAA